jgi:UDP-2-acetamido-3-amino-2,3-dideoxy-glucuronate N-acetyltransferase
MSIHPSAIVETNEVGTNTSILANSHILSGAVIGRDCVISDGVFVEGGVRIGDRVTLKPGVQLSAGVELEDDVTVGPGAVFSNEPHSDERQEGIAPLKILVKAGASIGANATILPGVTVGHRARIGAGAVVTSNIPQNAVVVGNPARIVGYVNSPRHSVTAITNLKETNKEVISSRVPGVSVVKIPTIPDLRGSLSFAEFERHIPFPAKRFFLIYDVPSRELRGEHAHKRNHQFLICIKGSVNALVDNGEEREEFILDSPNVGIHIPPMIWGTQYKYTEDAVLLVFASHLYESEDYIRDYQDFVKAVKIAKEN